jgi:hypothetical protein
LEVRDLSLTENRKFLKTYGLFTEEEVEEAKRGLHTDEEVEERVKKAEKAANEREKEAIRKMFSINMSVDTIADIYPKELVLEVQAEIAEGKA